MVNNLLIRSYTLPETNSIFAPENRASQKEASNHPFPGAFAVSFKGNISPTYWGGLVAQVTS